MNGLDEMMDRYQEGVTLGKSGKPLPTDLDDTALRLNFAEIEELCSNFILIEQNPIYIIRDPSGSKDRFSELKHIKHFTGSVPYKEINPKKPFAGSSPYHDLVLDDIPDNETVKIPQDQGRVDFRRGVFDGIEALLGNNGTTVMHLFPGETATTLLATIFAVQKYNEGLARFIMPSQLPYVRPKKIERTEEGWAIKSDDPTKGDSKGYFSIVNRIYDFSDKNHPSNLDRSITSEEPITNLLEIMCLSGMEHTYKLGFIVGVLVEKGVLMQPSEVPMTHDSVTSFNKGYGGETKPLKTYDLDALFNMTQFLPGMNDESAYRTGLNIWLRHIGAGVIPVDVIRDPEALEAFKTEYLAKEIIPSKADETNIPDYSAIICGSELGTDYYLQLGTNRVESNILPKSFRDYCQSNVRSGAPLGAKAFLDNPLDVLRTINDPVARGRQAAVYARNNQQITFKNI